MISQLLIGSGGGPLVCDSADFDHATNRMARGGALTGVVDGKKGTFSAWVRLDGSNATIMHVFGAISNNLRLYRDTDNKFYLIGKNAGGSIILLMKTVATYTSGATWLHILASWDLASGAASIYVNDASDVSVTTATNDTLEYVMATPDWQIGASGAGSQIWDGCLAEFFLSTTTYLDLSVEANRRLFITAAGKPAYMGAAGELPTGEIPAIYLHIGNGEAVANFATNRAAGGSFTITGTLSTGSTSPSD